MPSGGVKKKSVPDSDERSVGAEVLECLVVGGSRGRGHEGGVRSEATGDGLDAVDERAGVLELRRSVLNKLRKTRKKIHLEVEEDLGSVGSTKGLLVGAGVDRDDTEGHGRGVLDGQVAESSTSSGDEDIIAGLGV